MKDNEIFWDRWSGKTGLSKMHQEPFNISHNFRFMESFPQSGYWRVYCLDDLWTGGSSCDGGGDYAWLNSAIYCIYWGLTVLFAVYTGV